jgi:uncharacterized protein YcbK (DUF882 family)
MIKSRNISSEYRRALLSRIAVAPFTLWLAPVLAMPANQVRSLSFFHTHTGERLVVTYFSDGNYVPESLAQIDHLLRDFRTGEVSPIDTGLLDTLNALASIRSGGTFEVISGYRSAATNAMLQKSGEGVATNSLHLQGRAVDVRLAGFDTVKLRDAAIALERGGVGYYAASDFVHLDTGRVRRW